MCPVAPLSWPAEAARQCGSGPVRTAQTSLRNLGGPDPDRVIDTLVGAFCSLHTSDWARERIIEFLNEHDKSPDAILAEAIQMGFLVGAG